MSDFTEKDIDKLFEYLNHKRDCDHRQHGGDCTCGLFEITDKIGLTDPH